MNFLYIQNSNFFYRTGPFFRKIRPPPLYNKKFSKFLKQVEYYSENLQPLPNRLPKWIISILLELFFRKPNQF